MSDEPFDNYVCPHCGGVDRYSVIEVCPHCLTGEESPNGEGVLPVVDP